MFRYRMQALPFLNRIRLRNMSDASKKIKVVINIPKESIVMKIEATPGSSIKTLVDENDELRLHLECACDGNAQCSTCHVLVDPIYFKKLNDMEEAEMDMIDLASDVTDFSRLGCQLRLDQNCDGIIFTIPENVNNLF
mmetsp:Transcript_17477/g.16812  ORF Transcript_17477/g.16812 Transcript_17477/m.16812 type:complete len:138 (-) Transcript_17477:3047-3460(-)